MPAQIPDSIADWSTTAGSNQPSGSANVGPDLDDNLRAMQVAVRQTYTRGSIASAATCDIGTVDAELITVTGTTGISSLGTTLGASGYGVHKLLTFAGVLTLTHSASLACITSANITTAAGDSCMVEYSASGWTMLWYARKSGQPVNSNVVFGDGTVGAPGIAFSANPSSGFYRIGTNNIGLSLGGVKVVDFGASTLAMSLTPTGNFSASPTYSFGMNLTLTTATATNAGSTGAVTISSADHAGTNYSGVVTIKSGNALAFTGGLYLSAGNCTNSTGAAPGAVSIQGGDTGTSAGAGAGGNVNIWAGGGVRNHGSVVYYGDINFGYHTVGGSVEIGTTVLRLSGKTGLLEFQDGVGTPVITSGAGTGATIVGTFHGVTVTFGTTAGTTLIVDLNLPSGCKPATNAPIPALAFQGAAAITHRVSALSSTSISITFASAPASGDKLHIQLQWFE